MGLKQSKTSNRTPARKDGEDGARSGTLEHVPRILAGELDVSWVPNTRYSRLNRRQQEQPPVHMGTRCSHNLWTFNAQKQ